MFTISKLAGLTSCIRGDAEDPETVETAKRTRAMLFSSSNVERLPLGVVRRIIGSLDASSVRPSEAHIYLIT
jgi:hypothetical protein